MVEPISIARLNNYALFTEIRKLLVDSLRKGLLTYPKDIVELRTLQQQAKLKHHHK